MVFGRRRSRNLFTDAKAIRRKRRFAALTALVLVGVVFAAFRNGPGQEPAAVADKMVRSVVPAALETVESGGAGLEFDAEPDTPVAVTGSFPQEMAGEDSGEVPHESPEDVAALSPSAWPSQDMPRVADDYKVPEEPALMVIEERVRRGETVSGMLGEFLSPLEINSLARACRPVHSVSRIRPGRPYRVVLERGVFKRFEYEMNNESVLVAEAGPDGFTARRDAITFDVRTVTVSGDIKSSLFAAVHRAGEHPALAVELSEIFAWDVDFVRDIRSGDNFSAVVEKRYRKGEFQGYGEIMAARFTNRGETFQGFLFEDQGRRAYYDENGRSLRKAFLKAPLSFRRISSGFSRSRLHPVLKIRRPHPGIDYAAPIGTPVKAVGDGVVVKRAWGRGAGNYVKIRHNSVYETSYMHLSKFAKGIRKGKKVYQGQVIAYVGSTGMSTGPHLDFRMKRNGRFVDPRKIKSPSAKPVSKERMADFRRVAAPLTALLDKASSKILAEADN